MARLVPPRDNRGRFVTKATSPRALHIATLRTDRVPRVNPLEIRRIRPELLVRRYGLWVHRCVSLNAQTAAAVPFKIFTRSRGNPTIKRMCDWGLRRRPTQAMKRYLRNELEIKPSLSVQKIVQGNIEDLVEVEAHPALELLGDVNPWIDGYAYRESLYSDLQIFGRAFTHLVDAAGSGLPSELWRILPEIVKIIPDPDEFVNRFIVGSGAQEVEYEPDEVLWFKLYDPSDPWGGVGPLEAWLKTVDAAFAIESFQEWLMRRGGVPDYVVKVEAGLSPEQKRAFRNEWRRLFGRMGNREESLAFLDGEGEIEPLGQSPKELQFGESQEAKRDQIGAAFGVPKPLLTSDDVNRANAREAKEAHIATTIWPLIQRVEDVLNERLLTRYEGGLVLIHQDPIPDDRAERAAERASKLSSGWSINEIRLEEDREPLEDPAADEPMVAATIMPLTQLLAGEQDADGIAAQGQEGLPAAGDLQTTQQRVLQGQQLVAARELVQAVVDGQLPEDSARGQLIVLFNLTEEQADLVLGSADTFEPEPPEMPMLPGGGGPPQLPPGGEGGEEPPPNGQEERSVPQVMVNVSVPGAQATREICRHVSTELIEAVESWRALWFKADPVGPPSAGGSLPVSRPEFAEEIVATQRAQAVALLKAIRDLLASGAALSAVLELIESQEEAVIWGAEISAVARRHLADLIGAQGASALSEALGFAQRVDGGEVGITFNLQNRRVQEYLANESRIIGKAATDAYRTEIREALLEATREGESVQQISKRIRTIATEFTKPRADRIARTEMAFAHMEGTIAGWEQSGVVIGKEFVLAPDACPWCEAVAAEFGDGRDGSENRTLGLREAFFEPGSVLTAEFPTADGETKVRRMTFDYEGLAERGVLAPPIHPNCRCDLRPVIGEEFR